MERVVTARVDEADAEKLRQIATFDGVTVAEEIREAVRILITQRYGDDAFRSRVREHLKFGEALLEKLGESAAAEQMDPALLDQKDRDR